MVPSAFAAAAMPASGLPDARAVEVSGIELRGIELSGEDDSDIELRGAEDGSDPLGPAPAMVDAGTALAGTVSTAATVGVVAEMEAVTEPGAGPPEELSDAPVHSGAAGHGRCPLPPTWPRST